MTRSATGTFSVVRRGLRAASDGRSIEKSTVLRHPPDRAKRSRTLPIESPCNRVCTINPATEYCMGCWRTIGEIIEWHGAGEARKAEILARLPARRGTGTAGDRSCPLDRRKNDERQKPGS
jgi:predicted Fe-S protein YdhL (DUF1289 family)